MGFYQIHSLLRAGTRNLRGAATDETIRVFRAIWTEQPVSFEGRYVRFPPLGAMPKPLQPGGIPIVIGGNSRPAVRRAVRLGDGWQPFKLSPADLRPYLDYLRTQAEQADRDLTGFTISARLGSFDVHSTVTAVFRIRGRFRRYTAGTPVSAPA